MFGGVYKYTRGSGGGVGKELDFSAKNRTIIMQKNEGKCIYCGKTATDADRVWAKSRGGNNTSKNGQPTCRYHNASKGAGLYPSDTTIGQLGRMICTGRGYTDD